MEPVATHLMTHIHIHDDTSLVVMAKRYASHISSCGQCNGEATSPVWLMLIEPVYLTSTV